MTRLAQLPRLPVLGLAPRLVAVCVLVACLAGGSVALTVISSARTALRDQILESHLEMADSIAGQITEYVRDAEGDAVDMAASPAVRHATETGDFTRLNSLLAAWQAKYQDRIDGLSLYSRDGVMQATAHANQMLVGAPVTGGNADIVKSVSSSGEVTLGHPMRSRTTGQAIVPIYVPVRSDAGDIEAVLSATLSLESLTTALDRLQVEPNSRITLMDIPTGIALDSIDASRILTAVTTGQNTASTLARAGQRGAIENTRSDGEDTLAAFTPVAEVNWAVLLQESSVTAFAPIEAMTRSALLWVGATMLVAGLIAVGVAITMVRPLRKLRATAERMASGDLGRRTGLRSADEIGNLGRAFDRMAEQLSHSVEELTYQALSDSLTSLPNRVLLRQRLAEAIARGADVALLLMDLDRFKEVNDTLGHQSGDALLSQLAERLTAAVRRCDTVARLGGDEFALLLAGTGQAQALAIAAELQAVVTQPFDLQGRMVNVGASIGVACPGEHARDADALLRCADVAMYEAKRLGQGVAVYEADRDQHTPDRLALIRELGDAIDQGGLTLAFQPLIDTQTGAIAGVEALVRWPHPRHGLMPPDQFVPLAEQTGLIGPMSRWVLGSALRQHAAWRRMGLDVPVSVNLSMRDLHDTKLPETVAAVLDETGVSAAALRLEITESGLMSDPSRAHETVARLRAIGVQLSIDDFGTGYSSLAYLKHLPVDELKIDRSFVQHMADDRSDLAIVRSTIDLAHNLGLRVVAEGVEDEPTHQLLRRFGCDRAQGYLFSRPVSGEDLTEWMLARIDAGSRRQDAA